MEEIKNTNQEIKEALLKRKEHIKAILTASFVLFLFSLVSLLVSIFSNKEESLTANDKLYIIVMSVTFVYIVFICFTFVLNMFIIATSILNICFANCCSPSLNIFYIHFYFLSIVFSKKSKNVVFGRKIIYYRLFRKGIRQIWHYSKTDRFFVPA